MKQRWSAAFVCVFFGAAAGGYFLSPVLQGQVPAVPAIPKELTSYRDVVKKVLPAVVSIEARAKVIAAEGEQKASVALRDAADIINQSPVALQLRYLQTLTNISAEKNSTIVFPVPIEMLRSFNISSSKH